MEHLLEVKDLSKVYPNGCQALKKVNISANKGEFLVIIGLSGSGKSTFLRCVNRLHDSSGGKIIFKGQDVTTVKGSLLRKVRSNIGMIFQHFNLIPRKSVLTNVLMGSLSRTTILSSIFGNYSTQDRIKAMEYLEIVGLSGKEHVRADNLSGGQQQRVAIARALMQNPDLLLADEPVASLDPATSNSVMKYLERINKELGVTVICNLHFLSLVRQYATRVIALNDGRVVFEGSPKDITDEWFKKIYGEDAVEVTIN